MKLKTKPSDKTHRRYLLINGNKKDIEAAILEGIGSIGWGKADPIFIKEINGKNILAVERKSVDLIKASFELYNKPILVEKVSGTIKSLN